MRTRLLTTLLLLFLAACGAAGAPPVDLPAPITGRVDVSAPDEAGNITITGAAGAVDGGLVVMAVNETEAGVLSLRFLDALIPSAHAAGEVYPPVCDTAWHACAYAAADGSFTIYLQAATGDAIAIGIVGLLGADSGVFISDLLRVTVPESGTPTPAANCSGQGVVGNAVDVKFAATGGVPILLKQGSATATNQLLIGGASPQTVAITGCHASSLAALSGATGDYLVATSALDRILWSGRLVNGVMRDRKSVTLDAQPLQAAFPGTQLAPLVTILTENTIEVRQVSPSDGSTLKVVTFVTNIQFTRSIRLDTFTLGSDTERALGLAIVGNADPASTYAILLRADDLAVLKSWKLDSFLTLPNILDGRLFTQESVSADVAFALIAGSAGGNQIVSYDILCDGDELGYKYDIANCVVIDRTPAITAQGQDAPTSFVRNLAIWGGPGLAQPFAITRDDGRVYQSLVQGTAPMTPILDWAVGDDIVAIAIDAAGGVLYGADATTDAIIQLAIP